MIMPFIMFNICNKFVHICEFSCTYLKVTDKYLYDFLFKIVVLVVYVLYYKC